MSTAAKWFGILLCIYLIWVAILVKASVLRVSVVIACVAGIIALMLSMWERRK